MSSYSPSNPADIGVAVLGAGRLGQTHIRNLAAIPNIHVAVVADPNADAAARGREIARATRASTNPMEAIHDADVDAVVIITPTGSHSTLIEAALRACKAVSSEKPIALEIEETARIVELWREMGVPVPAGLPAPVRPGLYCGRSS